MSKFFKTVKTDDDIKSGRRDTDGYGQFRSDYSLRHLHKRNATEKIHGIENAVRPQKPQMNKPIQSRNNNTSAVIINRRTNWHQPVLPNVNITSTVVYWIISPKIDSPNPMIIHILGHYNTYRKHSFVFSLNLIPSFVLKEKVKTPLEGFKWKWVTVAKSVRWELLKNRVWCTARVLAEPSPTKFCRCGQSINLIIDNNLCQSITINPLNPNIKIQILFCFPLSFQ